MAKNPDQLVRENESFEELMDFLANDEQQAIDGYDEVIDQLDDEFVIDQLKKIRKEEEDHLAYLRGVKENHKLEYIDKGDSK